VSAEKTIVATYFHGSGDPARLRILEALAAGVRSVGELVELIGVPQPKAEHVAACRRIDAGLTPVCRP
jgi:DNA-binding transcriptional ArsR family regulator